MLSKNLKDLNKKENKHVYEYKTKLLRWQFSKIVLQIEWNCTVILVGFVVENGGQIIKFIQKWERCRLSNAILKKNKVGAPVPDYKVPIIKTGRYLHKNKKKNRSL